MTWICVWALVCLGYLLLILPGIYIAFRLFWADEYALHDGAPPWRAIARSWRLTSDAQGIFSFQYRTGLAIWLFTIAVGLPVMGAINLAYVSIPPAFASIISNLFLAITGLAVFSLFHAIQACFFHGYLVAEDN